MGISRQEYWSGYNITQYKNPFPPSGDLPDPRIEAGSPILAGRFFTTVPPGIPCSFLYSLVYSSCSETWPNEDILSRHEDPGNQWQQILRKLGIRQAIYAQYLKTPSGHVYYSTRCRKSYTCELNCETEDAGCPLSTADLGKQTNPRTGTNCGKDPREMELQKPHSYSEGCKGSNENNPEAKVV